MKEPQRITLVYEDYLRALLKALGEIIGWQNRVSPETKKELDSLNKKRLRVQRRYLDV